MERNLSQQTFAKSLIFVVWTKIAADIFRNEVSSDLLSRHLHSDSSTLFPDWVYKTDLHICGTLASSCKLLLLGKAGADGYVQIWGYPLTAETTKP